MSKLKTKGFRTGLLAGAAAAVALGGASILLLPGASAQAPRLVAPPPHGFKVVVRVRSVLPSPS